MTFSRHAIRKYENINHLIWTVIVRIMTGASLYVNNPKTSSFNSNLDTRNMNKNNWYCYHNRYKSAICLGQIQLAFPFLLTYVISIWTIQTVLVAWLANMLRYSSCLLINNKTPTCAADLELRHFRFQKPKTKNIVCDTSGEIPWITQDLLIIILF